MKNAYFFGRYARTATKPVQQAVAAVRPAEPKPCNRTLQVCQRDAVSFVREAVALFGGADSGVEVGINTSFNRQVVEVFGQLPRELRRRLTRVLAYWDRPRRASVSWDDVPIVWHTTRNGYGPRFAVPGLAALLDLIAERRLVLDGGRT